SEHRLGTGGRDREVSAAIREWIAELVQPSFRLAVLDLDVRDRRPALRTPVDHSLAAVDQPILIQPDEHVADSLGEPYVEREAHPSPVAGGAQPFELVADHIPMLLFPLP